MIYEWSITDYMIGVLKTNNSPNDLNVLLGNEAHIQESIIELKFRSKTIDIHTLHQTKSLLERICLNANDITLLVSVMSIHEPFVMQERLVLEQVFANHVEAHNNVLF